MIQQSLVIFALLLPFICTNDTNAKINDGNVQINDSNAEIKDGNYYIYSNNSFLALTGGKNDDGTSSLTTEAKSSKNPKNQIWSVQKKGNGYTLQNVGTSEYIDVYGSSKEADAEVNTYEASSESNQTFIFEKTGNSYWIKGAQSNKYLSTYDYRRKPGSNIIQRKNGNSDLELWRFTPADAPILLYNDAALVALPSQLDNKNRTYTINPVPARNAEATRMARNAPADYIPAGVYVRKGETLNIETSGLNGLSEDFLLLVGEPNAYWGNKADNNPYQYVLKNGSNSLVSDRSGLLYFNYTNHPFQYYKNNAVQVKITKGGATSPLFIHQKTTAADWETQLKATSLFVQFLSDKAIITIKKNTFNQHRTANPDKTFEVLHQVLDYSNALAGFDNTTFLNKSTPLRTHYIEDDITTDAEYKDGVYMYAGDAFVGMQPNSVGDLINTELLKKQWSIWHETGHLFQTDDWTWSEMTEVTVNLFSLNTQEKFGNTSRIYEPDGYEDQSISAVAKKYLKSTNKKFAVGDKYEMNFVCMVMFEQLRKAFGNKFYVNLNQFYRKNPLTLVQVGDEEVVQQEFMFNSCQISGFNLTNFFEKWGLPISEATKKKIEKLRLPLADAKIATYFVE